MKTPNRSISLVLVAALLLAYVPLRAESVDDRFTEVAPPPPSAGSKGDLSEFMHGTNYGKVLMRILMLGSVPKQGVHYVPEGTDLLFGILYAGGYGDQSKLNGITIRRRNVPSSIHVDLEDLVEDGKPIPKLQDGDVVSVPFSWRKDFTTVTLITSFLTSLTSLALSVVAISRH